MKQPKMSINFLVGYLLCRALFAKSIDLTFARVDDRYWTNRSLVADIISAVDFDQTGDFLATGDKGGRIVIFERNTNVSASTQLQRTSLALLMYLVLIPILFDERRKVAASTSSTPSFSHMNRNSIA
jgi:hypothetical protein